MNEANRHAFELPHCDSSTKYKKRNSLKFCLISLLDQEKSNKLYLYTLTEEQETEANHEIEATQLFINQTATSPLLPDTLFVHFDDCTRENKNRYMFAYLKCLLHSGAFMSIETGILSVGNTRKDIDQAFSKTSNRLHSENDVTLSDFHDVLQKIFAGAVAVVYWKVIVSWSGLCEHSKTINIVRLFHSTNTFLSRKCQLIQIYKIEERHSAS